MSNKTKIILIAGVILLAAASRLVKHPFNFTPVAAMSIFAGYYLKERWGILLPLAAMLVSDYFIGFYEWQAMASVYAGIALAYLAGYLLRKKLTWHGVAFAALGSSIVFFLVTNFAVWAFFSWYPHTWEGLALCFTSALPFFRNSLAGDIVYTGALFGAFEAVRVLAARKIAKGTVSAG